MKNEVSFDNNVVIWDRKTEWNLLALILLRQENSHEIIPYLEAEDFYDINDRQLFIIMRDLYDQAKSINEDSILEKAIELGYLNVDEFFLAEVYTANAFVQNLVDYREKLIELSKLRKLQNGINEVNSLLYRQVSNSEEVIDKLQNLIFQIERVDNGKLFLSSQEVSNSYYEKLNILKNRDDNEIVGLSTGFSSLDYVNQGFQPTELIILAARPAVGKTTLALNIALNVANNKLNPKNVAFFSLEMSPEQLMSKIYSTISGVEASKLKNVKFLTNDEWIKIANAKINHIDKLNLFIDDTGSATLRTLIWKAKRLHKQKKLDLIIVDYLQLITTDNLNKNDNRQIEVSKVSRSLKLLAKELNIPIIALSQLSRDVEKRQDKEPMLSDLRESGAIEQDADIVAFLHREDYYNSGKRNNLNKENEDSDLKDIAITKLIIAKNRSGPTTDVEFIFKKSIGKFFDKKELFDTYNNQIKNDFN
ncbi:Replicative DNA helicase [Mycoplasmopsis meleagridis]|uniref:Replicative DNA helicase n=1 Tax=Mycoplasmopsis meleagridis ATCC 25294 TaxID=1264554 RepID=A0A0F5H1U6_9BACT|nr:replicative DNA helicase [Mycoplasmopsis meleagridis]KKB26812.1 Replicative DNA helicase [Mycoplasmopsis meleagridis ATCC 25294]OAD18409.1 Replicative DNA helicase [Mycoplasmopsis meleagridis]VEU77450.1 Replicative DNA helicase [Mycoplasmopsis meleagridis]